MRRVVQTVTRFTAAVALAALPACFNPDRPACAFSCATPPRDCPSGYTCGPDDLCHAAGGAGVCLIDLPDGGDGGGDASD